MKSQRPKLTLMTNRHPANEASLYPSEDAFAEPAAQPHAVRNYLHLSGKWLLAADLCALVLAFVCGGFGAWLIGVVMLGGSLHDIWSLQTVQEFCLFAGPGIVALLWLAHRGHYRQRLPYWEKIGQLLAAPLAGFFVSGFLQFAFQSPFSRLWLGLDWVFFGILLIAGRIMVRRRLEKKGMWNIPAILIGTGPTAKAALHALRREGHMGYAIEEQFSPEVLKSLSRDGEWRKLMRACMSDHIFLALEGRDMETYRPSLEALFRERLPCSFVPPWIGLPVGTLSPHYFMLHDVMMMHDINRLELPLPRLLKRSFDIIVSGTLLLMLSPVLAWAAIRVRSDGGPALFSQQRVGLGGRLFACYKFRSMRVDAETYLTQYLAENAEAAEEWKRFQKLKNDVRITEFGHFIRRVSIDELPQLINVFKGDMSLVGPRPIIPEQCVFYGHDLSFYQSVRPGITGPWQVSGRNKLTFSERVLLETCYARNWSLWMDIVIMLKTVPALLEKDQAF